MVALLEPPTLRGALQPHEIKDIIHGCVFRNYNVLYDQYANKLFISVKVLDRRDDAKLKKETEERRSARWEQRMYDEGTRNYRMRDIGPYDYESPAWDYQQFKELSTLQAVHVVPEMLSRAQVVSWVFYVVACAEAHEMCENFYYEGERVFDPHVDNRVEKAMILPFFINLEPELPKISEKTRKNADSGYF